GPRERYRVGVARHTGQGSFRESWEIGFTVAQQRGEIGIGRIINTGDVEVGQRGIPGSADVDGDDGARANGGVEGNRDWLGRSSKARRIQHGDFGAVRGGKRKGIEVGSQKFSGA